MSTLVTASDELRLETAALGGSALSLAVQRGELPASWRVGRPTDVHGWRAHAEEVRASAGAWLERLRPAFGQSLQSVAARRIERAAADGVIVTTGQQPGLFGGPAYTLTKALSALALADELAEQLGIPVAPVFWAATDDADWNEAAVTHVVGRDGLERLSLTGTATDGVAMADVPLGDVSAQRASLRAACGSVADPMVLDLIDAAYDQGATVGSSYVTWLRSMLDPLGISVLDASHPSLRQSSHAMLSRALQHAAAIDAALRDRTAAIEIAGFLPQVEAVDGLSQVFQTIYTVRSRVPLANAARVAESAPVGSLGANVLLRPVLERSLMPTVAYVAGPGELAYFAQVAAVAEAAQCATPIAVPRWAARWREAHVDRVLERLGVQEEELQTEHAAETRLARAAMDRDVADSLDRLRVTLTTQLTALGQAVSADDSLVPASVLEGLTRDLEHRLSRMERRLVAAVKRRETETARDLAIARAALFPLGSAPERKLSLVPTLARYGLGVLTDMKRLASVHARALVRGSSSSAE